MNFSNQDKKIISLGLIANVVVANLVESARMLLLIIMQIKIIYYFHVIHRETGSKDGAIDAQTAGNNHRKIMEGTFTKYFAKEYKKY